MTPVEPTAEEQQARRVYGDLLTHFEGCAPCRAEDYCPVGGRLRSAHRATRSALPGASLYISMASSPPQERV